MDSRCMYSQKYSCLLSLNIDKQPSNGDYDDLSTLCQELLFVIAEIDF